MVRRRASISWPTPARWARSREKADSIEALEQALARARDRDRSCCIVIDTDPAAATEAGGHWWDVPVPEVSEREAVRAARAGYEEAIARQRAGD